jgi:SP family galactose:H+ symporter-like MFS transporter
MSESETGNPNQQDAGLRGSVSRLNVLIGGTAAIIGVINGYDLGSIASAILFLEPDLGLSTFMVSVVTATVVLGQLFGAFSAGLITNRLGRKRTMVGIALGYVIFAALQGLAPNEWFLIVARFLLGFTIGVSIVTAPAYIAESSPRSVRGSMIVTFQIATVAGIAVSYFVGAALAGLESWRLILSLSAIPALIVLFFVLRLPDTPRWYLMNGQRAEALNLIRRVQGDVDPEEEVQRIEEDLAYEEKGSFTEIFQGRFRLAGIFVVMLGFLVQITGINAIVYYSPTIITQVGVTDPFRAIAVNGLIQLAGVVAVVVSFLVVDRWGRRPTLLFVVGFNFGYGSLVWVYASESFPVRLRTQGGSAMLTSDLFANFLVGVVFLNALGALGGSLTFGIFCGLAIISFLFIYALAPETKGRQLEAIRQYWYNGAKWPEEAEKART